MVTDEYGRRLAVSLDVTTNMLWLGYANQHIYAQVNPTLHTLFHEHNPLIVNEGANDDVAH